MKLNSLHFMFGLLCMLGIVFAYRGVIDAHHAFIQYKALVYEQSLIAARQQAHDEVLQWATREQLIEATRDK